MFTSMDADETSRELADGLTEATAVIGVLFACTTVVGRPGGLAEEVEITEAERAAEA